MKLQDLNLMNQSCQTKGTKRVPIGMPEGVLPILKQEIKQLVNQGLLLEKEKTM